MRLEKRFVVQLQHGQINARINRHHGGRDFVAGLVGLDLHLAGVIDDMGVGKDSFPLDHHTRTRDFTGRFLNPRMEEIGITHRGKYFHHRVFHRVTARGGRGGRDGIGLSRFILRRGPGGPDLENGKRQRGGEEQAGAKRGRAG